MKELLKGYTVIKNIIPQYSIDKALHIINKEMGKGLPGDIFSWGMNCESGQSEEVTGLLYQTPLWNICGKLINLPRHRGCQVALRFPSDAGRGSLHLDGIYNGQEDKLDSFTAIIGIPLSPVKTRDVGELRVLPNSHNILSDIYKIRNNYEDVIDYIKAPDYGEERIFMDVGDAVIMNSFLLHDPAPNFSSNIRYAVYFRLDIPFHSKGWDNLKNVWEDWNL